MVVKISGVILFCLFITLVLPVTAATSSGIGEDFIYGDYPIEDFQSSLLWSPVSPSIQQATSGSNLYISDLDVQAEYVKITNGGWDSVTMTGWRITNGDGSRAINFIEWTNPDGSKFNYELRGYSTVTIYSPKEGSPSRTSLYWPKEMWYDGGDTAYLYDNTGKLVSTYSSTGGTGTLAVTSTPTGAMVVLDGVNKGVTPITLTGISPGTHQLRVTRSGYDDFSTSITISPGMTVTIPVMLQVQSGPTTVPTTIPATSPTQGPTGTGTGGITVTSTPTRAMVFIDGVYKGVTPLTLTGISSGIHQIRVTYSGYEDYSSGVNVPAGKTITFPVILKVASGSTTVPTTIPTTSPTQGPTGTGTGGITVTSTPTRAMVFLDGVYKGVTPLTISGMSSGIHQIRVTYPGYEDYSSGVNIPAGKTITFQVILKVGSGTTVPTPVPTTVPTTSPTQGPTGTGTGGLTVTSTPTRAMVFLDGIYKGLTPLTITGTPAGTHQLKVHRIGYEDYSASITVITAQTLNVPVTLKASSGTTPVPTTVPTTSPTQGPMGTGTLVITSTPPEAKVYLDLVFVGNTPLTVPNLPAGSHRISIRKSLYLNNSTTVIVNPDSTTTYSVTLTPIWGGLNPFN